MSQTEADTIVTEIRVECAKHEECSDCAFNEFCVMNFVKLYRKKMKE